MCVSLCGFAQQRYHQGFETWREYQSYAGNAWLERYVKEGWLGEAPPYRLPQTDFQMGPAHIMRREGHTGQYALGMKTADTPTNVLLGNMRIPGKPGSRFRMTVWLRGTGTVRFRVYEYGADNRCIGTPFVHTCQATPDWQPHAAVFENSRPDIAVWFPVLEVGPAADVVIDEVTVGEGGDGQELIMPIGAPAPVADGETIAVAFPTDAAMAVDGKLNEAAWQQAEWHANFLQHRDQTRPSRVQAQFAFLYDADHLYLGFISAEHGLDSTAIPTTSPGQWPKGDPVEWFLDPGATRDVYFQFAANIIGGTYEARMLDARWDCAWRATGASEGYRWTLEVAIPFAAFNRTTPKPGEMWSMNICRNGEHMGPWAPVGPNYHVPAGFGLLTFGRYEQWWQSVTAHQREQAQALVRTLQTLSDPQFTRQAALIDRRTRDSETVAREIAGQAITRETFLAAFSQTEQLRTLLTNAEHELRWVHAIR
jgi:hypothetical protein